MKHLTIIIVGLLWALGTFPAPARCAAASAPDNAAATATNAPEVAPPESPETVPPSEPPPPPSAPASLNPDISVVGNALGSLANHQLTPEEPSKHIKLDETEVVIGSKLYPGVSGLAVFTAGGNRGDAAGVEESYISAEQLFTALPVGGRLGIARLPFGKINPLHPHSLPFADTPNVLSNLLGDLRGNGFELVGLIPTHSNIFLQANLGRWVSVGDPAISNPIDLDTGLTQTGPAFNDKAITLGRLWASAPVGEDNEFELGTSAAFGDADMSTLVPGQTNPRLNIYGMDATWRTYLPNEQRLLLSSEALQRYDGTIKTNGYYVLGTFRPGHFYEYGARYDWSQFAADNTHHEAYGSLFATHYLSEQTFLRLQVKHGTDRLDRNDTELIAQVVYGFGPHTHPLQ